MGHFPVLLPIQDLTVIPTPPDSSRLSMASLILLNQGFSKKPLYHSTVGQAFLGGRVVDGFLKVSSPQHHSHLKLLSRAGQNLPGKVMELGGLELTFSESRVLCAAFRTREVPEIRPEAWMKCIQFGSFQGQKYGGRDCRSSQDRGPGGHCDGHPWCPDGKLRPREGKGPVDQ